MQGAWETLSRLSKAQARQDQRQERGSQAGCPERSELVAEDGPKEGDAVLVGHGVLGHAVGGARWGQAFSEALMKGQREL